MKREEREQLLKDTLLYFAPKDRYVTDEEGNVYYREDVTLKAMELSEQPLPPAEGAAYDGMMFTIYEDGINSLDDEQQPTAEGAEEILEKHLNFKFKDTPEDWTVALIQFNQEKFIAAMTEFAALHAQKIADKMVSEKLREEKK